MFPGCRSMSVVVRYVPSRWGAAIGRSGKRLRGSRRSAAGLRNAERASVRKWITDKIVRERIGRDRHPTTRHRLRSIASRRTDRCQEV